MRYNLPTMYDVYQHLDRESVSGINEQIRLELSKPEVSECIHPGANVAVAVGSRGISDIYTIVKSVVEVLVERKANPFIVGAMGSHGGGTEEGQRQILASYGITPENLGVPVVTNPSTVEVEKNTKYGIPLYMSEAAYNADLIIPINRIKMHTDFDGHGNVESGICKMAVVGLGNYKGCDTIHSTHDKGFDFSEMISDLSGCLFKKTNIRFGIGIVENGVGGVSILEAIRVEQLPEREIELLKLSMEKTPKLHFPEIDVLIIEEIGKNISGTGADTNIIGRFIPKDSTREHPDVKKVVILDITKESHGNATGIGLADYISSVAYDKMDYDITLTNCLAGDTEEDMLFAQIPIVLECDDAAIAAAISSCCEDQDKCKIVRIKNTSSLEHMQVSKELLPFVDENPQWFFR